MSALAWACVGHVLAPVRSVFNEEEKLSHRRIVPDVAGCTDAADDAVVGQEPLEALTGVPAAPIGVMQHGTGLAPPPDRHHARIGDELRGPCRTHGPVDYPSREEIDDRSDVEPAFGGPEVGEVRPGPNGGLSKWRRIHRLWRQGWLRSTQKDRAAVLVLEPPFA